MSDTRTPFQGIDRFRAGVVALAVGIACILSLARITRDVGGLEAAVAFVGVALLASGTVAVGSSAGTGV
ncbi:hypothetical protein [Halorarius halobius]|uniref:hypothetical protein n=1 Tax=Halorarius halobius TaxID=2962671 RepID=UPI0020CC57F7|nr:hypothetical protein [Halorarius halobius]